MPRPEVERLTHRWAGRRLAVIVVLAVVVRVASALAEGSAVEPWPGVYDQVSYHALAQRVAAGFGFSFADGHWPATRAEEPTAHWSFLYTLYLSAIYALVGVQPFLARLIQALVVGIAQPWLAYRIGTRTLGPAVGVVAAGLTAGYAYFVFYAGALMTESFYFVGILWSLDAALGIAASERTPRMRSWLGLGLAVALTALLRQVYLVFVPVLFGWIWWSRRATRERPSTMAGLAAAAAVVVLAIAPWSVRNYRAFGTWVPLNTNAGFAFFWGNHPVHGVHFQPLLPSDGPRYDELIPPELRYLNEGALDRALLRRGLDLVAADPWRFVRLSVSRIPEYIKFWPSTDSGALSNIARVGSFGLCLPLMIAGFWMVRRSWPTIDKREREAVLLLTGWGCVYAAVHLATWTLIRYRLPIDAVWIVFAAVPVARIGVAAGWLPSSEG